MTSPGIRARVVGAIVVAFGNALLIAHQTPPARDLVTLPTIGASSISGVVVDDQNPPQPVRRAIVTLAGDGLRPNRGAITDDDGRFTIRGLPPGSFNLSVTRPGFVTSMFGAKRPGRPGTAVVVPVDGHVSDVVVRLWRGAVLSGTIRDAAGRPLPGTTVRAVPLKSAPASLLTLTNNGVQTNARGEFRIFGLEPGPYYVLVEPRTAGVGIVSPKDAEVDAIFDAVRRRASARPQDMSPATVIPIDAAMYSPLYYPGVTSLAAATLVDLKTGQETGAIDVAVTLIRTGAVSGTVLRADGTPGAGGRVQLSEIVDSSNVGFPTRVVGDVTVAPDGTFRFSAVGPNHYRLIARVPPAGEPPPAVVSFIPPSTPQLWAATTITTSGSDVGGVNLVAGSGLTVSGTVKFESTTRQAPTGLVSSVFLAPASTRRMAEGTAIMDIGMSSPATVAADGTFKILSVPPGRFRLLVDGPGLDKSPWWLLSAKLGDRDLADADFDIEGTGTAPLSITFTDKRTQLEGTLQSEAGQPVSDVFILAFPIDRREWAAYSRRIKAVRPSVSGAFAIADLPPGDYLICALSDVDEDDWQVPGFLERLEPLAVKVTLTLGQVAKQDLKIKSSR